MTKWLFEQDLDCFPNRINLPAEVHFADVLHGFLQCAAGEIYERFISVSRITAILPKIP